MAKKSTSSRANAALIKASNPEEAKLVIQSYVLTTAKYDFNVYEKRILYRLVELAQAELQGVKLKPARKIKPVHLGQEITLPISSLLNGEQDKNHERVKEALRSLATKLIEYEDGRVWKGFQIVICPSIEKYEDTVTFTVHKLIWDCILDFSKGYRKYELKAAMQFKSAYTMRLYELLSGKTQPIKYDLEDLKMRFRVGDKYKQVNDFVRFVLKPAKKELDECSPFSFTFEPYKHGRRIAGFTFFPVFFPERVDPTVAEKDIKRKISIGWDVPRDVRAYLMDAVGFTEVEIKNNRDVFKKAVETIPDFLGELAILNGKSREKNNPKGWLINAIKGKIKDTKEETTKKQQTQDNTLENIAGGLADMFGVK